MRKKITECNDEHVLNELKDCIKHCLKSTVVCSLSIHQSRKMTDCLTALIMNR